MRRRCADHSAGPRAPMAGVPGRARGGPAEAGFTLLELLVSLGIVAILIIAQVAPFRRAIDARDRAESTMQRTGAIRVTLQRIGEELAGAVPVKGEAFSVSDRSFDRPASELAFATTAARRMRRGAQDPIEQVRYRLEAAPPGERGARLVKEQLPSIAAPGTPPPTSVVLDDVAAFRVRVLPGGAKDFAETWRGGEGGRTEDLPQAVEIELALEDGANEPTPYRLLVSLPMGPRS